MAFIYSKDWTYERGWRSHEIVDTEHSLYLKDKLRVWDYLARWRRFPQLGPPPIKWLRFGDPPDGIAFVNTVMQAHLTAPIAAELNRPNTLLSFFRNA